MTVTLLPGDCLDVLRTLPTASVHCVVTSPPYFGLRAYNGGEQEIGSEATPDAYVARLVDVFREVKRVLRDDGTVFLNLGDSYASDPAKGGSGTPNGRNGRGENYPRPGLGGLASKQLLGIPWRVAFALQADGWLLRSDIVWSKPNCMPESVKDRPTKAHEYVFLLAKQGRYYYDADAVREPYSGPMYEGRDNGAILNGDRGDRGKTCGMTNPAGRNRRSVWHIATTPFSARSVGIDDVDHFAVMPPKLVEPCVLAGCPVGGVVLDPFCGAGTVGLVSVRHGRHFIGIDLNPRYLEIARRRIEKAAPVLPLLMTGD